MGRRGVATPFLFSTYKHGRATTLVARAIKGGLYESGCNGRRGRFEAATTDDSTAQANGSYCREAGNGAYSSLVEASWYHRGCHYRSVSGEQH